MIKNEWPPNIDQISDAFPKVLASYVDRHHPDAPKGLLFAYDEHIYNPHGVYVSPALKAHEIQHCVRQFQRADEWWTRYIEDNEFRYDEELRGHASELRVLLGMTKDRNHRAKMYTNTAARLIAPLYNYVPQRTLTQATKDLRQLVG